MLVEDRLMTAIIEFKAINKKMPAVICMSEDVRKSFDNECKYEMFGGVTKIVRYLSIEINTVVGADVVEVY